MDMGDISRLASHLRENGDTILNAGAKLTLTSALLHNLNEVFPMLVDTDNQNDPFRVINANSSSLDIFHDLAFLHDFIQRTESLKVFGSPRVQVPNSIDISKFSVLKSLELNKIPVEILSGIQYLSSQLDTLICTQCMGSLEEVLNCCFTDSKTTEWRRLRKAVFSYNALESIDQFLHYVPWLQVLDLSHNHLTNANAVHCLPNLKCLNLGYNFLRSLPTFNAAASDRLISLIIKFNHLEDVEGLFGLSSLQDLDLSCNCLSDHRLCLSSLLGLSSLSILWLSGNPLSFHKKHRIQTAQCLHINTIHREFVLDGDALSKSERSAIGSRSADTQSYSASVESSATYSQITDEGSLSQTQKYQPSRRSGRVRDAIISDYQEIAIENQMNESVLISSADTSMEHLQTMKQLEILRETFGEENWLHSQSGSCVQSILGLPQSPKPGVLSSISSLYSKEPAGSMNEYIPQKEHDQENEVCTTKNPSDMLNEAVLLVDAMFSSKEMSPELQDSDTSDEDEDTTEIEEHVYPVQRDSVELFLVITQFHIRERDVTFGKTVEKWSVNSLLSCVQSGNDPISVQFTFDTLRRERQKRIYIMDDEDAQKIIKALGKVLESRSFQAKVHRCLNCSSQFTREVDFWDSVSKCVDFSCPNCHSLLVVEMDEVPSPYKSIDNLEKQSFRDDRTPTLNNNSSMENVHTLAQSPSKSSIGAAVGSSVCNPDLVQTVAFIHYTDDSSGTNKSTTVHTPARSAASLDHSPDWSSTVSETVVQRSDSDIEVISNPSQSSIEIIEDKGTPSRKRSEEPLMEQAPVPPLVQPTASLGLTESSSSDSFTESVCTTYENRSYSSKGSSAHRSEEKNDETISEENENFDNIIIKSSTFLQEMDSTAKSSHFTQNHKRSFTSALDGAVDAVSCTDALGMNRNLEHDSTVKYSYVDYTQVDHRVKLHLYQHVFKDEDEELTLLVRAHILEQLHSASYPGCVAFSSRKIYFLKVTGHEGDDPDNWLEKILSINMDQLIAIHSLPWNQGICLKFQSPDSLASNNCLLLLKDKQRTLKLVDILLGLPLPEGCQYIEHSSTASVDTLIQALRSNDENPHVCSLVSIFNHCKIISDLAVSNHCLGVMLITESDLLISHNSLLWMIPDSTEKVHVLTVQKIMNLITVEVTTDDCLLELHFLDETVDKDEVWCLSLETADSLRDIVSAIQFPWENLFSVPLEIKVNSRSHIRT